MHPQSLTKKLYKKGLGVQRFRGSGFEGLRSESKLLPGGYIEDYTGEYYRG